ncbi:Lactation elevated protein 1 [Hordeum vulgare]|nr:Lactation elevated protein 1 [Hordeum vulgare]
MARAPGANAAVRSRPTAQNTGKATVVKRRKVPASRKPHYSTSDFTPPKSGSNNATNEFMNMLDTNAVDIDQASFKPFNYNETNGGVDDHGDADELEEIEAEAFEQSQAKGGKSQRYKNYTILEDQALIQAWSAVSLDACTGVSQTAKRYWQRIEDRYVRIMKKYPNRTAHTFRSLQGRWENIKPMRSRWAACLEQVCNAPPSGTVESDYDKIAQHRYKDMEDSKGKFFKLEHCWELLQKCDKWKLINRESPPKRGSLVNMDEDEDDDDPRNLHKPDGDKKTKEKMKREQEAASLREKIDAMVQSNELMLLKSLEIKKELAENKAKEKQEKWQMLKEEGLRKAAIEERKARASETKSISLLLAEENTIMSMNRNDMDDLTKTWHDMCCNNKSPSLKSGPLAFQDEQTGNSVQGIL